MSLAELSGTRESLQEENEELLLGIIDRRNELSDVGVLMTDFRF